MAKWLLAKCHLVNWSASDKAKRGDVSHRAITYPSTAGSGAQEKPVCTPGHPTPPSTLLFTGLPPNEVDFGIFRVTHARHNMQAILHPYPFSQLNPSRPSGKTLWLLPDNDQERNGQNSMWFGKRENQGGGNRAGSVESRLCLGVGVHQGSPVWASTGKSQGPWPTRRAANASTDL